MSRNTPAVIAPSWRVGIGLFALTMGYLVVLTGVTFYAWGTLHVIYGVPTLAVVAGGIVAVLVGGVVLRAEYRDR